MLAESRDVIRHVFLLSLDLWSFMLDVGGGSEPIFSSWECRDLGVSRAVMSLGQSPLATSYGVGTSGWTVCYNGDKSGDSGMAIS